MRLDKYICKSTELSKCEALEAIEKQQVKVNDKLALHAELQVHKNNLVTLNGAPLILRPFRYLLFHKPENTLCSNVDEAHPSIFHHIDIDRKMEMHIVGRLDVDTTGLVLLTDDGSWTYRIITPNAQCEKVYRVKLRKAICDEAVQKLEQGIKLQGLDRPTRPAKVTVLDAHEVRLTITQGHFHQVKRMFRAVGNKVCGLHREKIGGVSLDVDIGRWRHLTEEEVQSFG